MKRRCYQCKCLQDESTSQFVKRTKHDLNSKFYCRKCKKEIILPSKIKYTDLEQISRKARNRYIDPINSHLFQNLRGSIKPQTVKISYEERIAIGRFIRKCPLGYHVKFKDGIREFAHIRYESDESDAKKANEFTKKMKSEILQITPFTHIPKAIIEIGISPEKRNRMSKYKRMRVLSKNKG